MPATPEGWRGSKPAKPQFTLSAFLFAMRLAPMRPPTMACEELEGSPQYHVTRFHAIAESVPASTTVTSAPEASI